MKYEVNAGRCVDRFLNPGTAAVVTPVVWSVLTVVIGSGQ